MGEFVWPGAWLTAGGQATIEQKTDKIIPQQKLEKTNIAYNRFDQIQVVDKSHLKLQIIIIIIKSLS